MVGSVYFPLSLLGIVLGTSKVFGLKKELAYSNHNHDDRYYTETEVNNLILFNKGIRIYPLINYFEAGVFDYIPGFIIKSVLYSNPYNDAMYMAKAPTEIAIMRGNTSYGYLRISETSIKYDMYPGCEEYTTLLTALIAFE